MKFDQDPVISGGNFLKLESGQETIGVLRGDVKTEYVLWENKIKTVVAAGSPGSKFSFSVNFIAINKDASLAPAQVWEGGPRVYKMLKELSKDYDLSQTVLKIKRTGVDKATTYSIIPLPKKPSDVTLAALNAAALLPLDSTESQGEGAVGEETPF